LTAQNRSAPGATGISPRWTSSAKSGIGTALTQASRVWFTLSHGILDEIYYPRVDTACTRDFGLIVTDGHEFFSEEKRQAAHQVDYLAPGVPAYRLINTDESGRYRIEKEILADPQGDVVLQRVRFLPVQGALADYHLFALLAPHLGNRGTGNTGWAGDYKGTPVLLAQREDLALALAASAPWRNRSVGYVGISDGWQDLSQHKQMVWTYDRAEDGNIALTAEIDLQACGGEFVLALGFGLTPFEAAQRSLSSLWEGFDSVQEKYAQAWQAWQGRLLALDAEGPGARDLYRTSMMVLRAHEGKRFPGGLIASLSIPWGESKGDDDLGGYHLVWPRDLVEAAGGLLAGGAGEDARRILRYLCMAQESDGHWAQNMWLDGEPYWSGMQMDETALPVLLVDLARREGALKGDDVNRLWPMVRRAAGFLVRNGPVTQEDRWEEDPGYSPFTLSAEIAALLAAADLAQEMREPEAATYMRETADTWNAKIERWTYVTDTDLARQVGVEGYYVRVAPPDQGESSSHLGLVPIKNRLPGQSDVPAAWIVSPDALALVRFGLRAAEDPRILNTVKVIDALLKVDTPCGAAWHRYDDDGYGEHDDGSPFDGTGIGRAWPLLSGERGHYELAAGDPQEAEALLRAMAAFANDGGLIPEQVWDQPDMPARELFFGRPSGSAMPLVWAHAEYVKLSRSLREGRVFDLPPQTVQRYLTAKTGSPYATWRFNQKLRAMPVGKTLRVEVIEPAMIHWTTDGWHAVHDTPTRDTGLGMHMVDLPTADLAAGDAVTFTMYWPGASKWEGVDYTVRVGIED
jgi:glucoamylase